MIKEKLELLKKTSDRLKNEFVGIDDIIDQVINNITPWYITPEIMERPVVVSLWGMTGTGKTTLVRKLIDYLDLSYKSVFFDCGSETSDQGISISEKIDDLFDGNESGFDSKDVTEGRSSRDFIFVFDEFQYSRTISEDGNEVNKPSLKSIWNLMDNGILDIVGYQYGLNCLFSLIDEIDYFRSTHPGIEIKNGYFPKDLNDEISKTIGIFYDTLVENRIEINLDEDIKEEHNGKYSILPKDKLMTLVRKINSIEGGLGYKINKELLEITSLDEYVDILKKYKKLIGKPKSINCNNSLIFILGNLDEAFGVHNDITPDLSADFFHEITDGTSITEIKKALLKRFRDEQVGRIGNNIIKYPSLREEDFRKIISNELDRITCRFKEISGITLEFTENLKGLIYYEGVYPVLGVRPVITTINSMINPKLSLILIEKSTETDKVIFGTEEDNYDKDSLDITLEFLDKTGKIEKTLVENQKLILGELRNPKNCSKIAIHAVHEASHAVAYAKLTGELSSSILSTLSESGAIVVKGYNKLDSRDIDSREDLMNELIISLAGYYGEREFFDENKCLLGSGSDIETAWSILSEAIYNSGLIEPVKFASGHGDVTPDTGANLGVPDDLISHCIKTGESKGMNIREKTYKIFLEAGENTKKLITSERELISKMAIYLSKNRNMTGDTMKRYIKKYSKTFGLESMKKMKKEKEDYYINALKKR